MNRTNLTRMILHAAFVAPVLVAATANASSVSLAPHRAYYELEAARIDKAGGISAISGKLAYEISGSDCDGYGVSYRIANRYVQGEGDMQVTDLQLTSFESGDGLELELRQKQFVNAKLDSESVVTVKKAKENDAGKGEITGSEVKSFTTAPAVIFPTKFQKHVLEVALSGKTRDVSLVFEGSDADKALKAISFIGPRKTAASASQQASDDISKELKNVAYWPMTISYYPVDSKDDAQPVYQASFDMYENGVSTNLLMDYGSYALKGKLSKIEMLKPEVCN